MTQHFSFLRYKQRKLAAGLLTPPSPSPSLIGLKKKVLRGSHSPFVNKKVQKAIYTRSKLKNKMNQNPSRENVLAYKKERNTCVSLRRKSLKMHLKSIKDKGISNNKSFWKFIESFLTNKGFIVSNDITLVENDGVTTDEKTLPGTFNKHCIKIVEKSSGKPHKNISKMSHGKSKQEVLCDVLNACKTYPSIK